MQILDALRDTARLGLDTAPIIYFIEGNQEFHARCTPFFAAIDRKEIEAITSTI